MSTETADDLRERLKKSARNADQGYPESWDPDPGEVLVGELTNVEEVTNQYGQCTVAEIEEEETSDRVAVWLGHKVLEDQFHEAHGDRDPVLGERIGIVYLGTKGGQDNGPEWHDYRVEVEFPADDSQSPDEALDDGEDLPF